MCDVISRLSENSTSTKLHGCTNKTKKTKKKHQQRLEDRLNCSMRIIFFAVQLLKIDSTHACRSHGLSDADLAGRAGLARPCNGLALQWQHDCHGLSVNNCCCLSAIVPEVNSNERTCLFSAILAKLGYFVLDSTKSLWKCVEEKCRMT